jgi:3-oxoacyl-[acyl-carrier protein] reductase
MRKVALVTGGTRGIGKTIAETLAQDYEVAVTWKSTAPAPGITAFEADLTEDGACQRVINGVIEKFGRLDVIVNNAGVVAQTLVEGSDDAVQERMMEVNALVPGRLLACALPHLKEGAAVVSISSTNAFCPPETAVIYGASKAALNAWTVGTAKELGPKGIRVNAVAPGAVNIPEAPRSADVTKGYAKEVALGRIGAPEDIAKVVRFLASDDAGYITGEVITVSGGWRL